MRLKPEMLLIKIKRKILIRKNLISDIKTIKNLHQSIKEKLIIACRNLKIYTRTGMIKIYFLNWFSAFLLPNQKLKPAGKQR